MADWSHLFDEPIPLSDGNSLRTLLDAGRFIEALPKAIHERPEWLTATRLLLMTAEGRGSMMFAQIALIKALNVAKPIRMTDDTSQRTR
jgi:hypothetical protein